MPFDLIGFSEAAPGNTAGGVNIARAAGDSLYTGGTGDYITLRAKISKLLGAVYGAESTPGYVRIHQASMGAYYQELIHSTDIEGGTLKPAVKDLRFKALKLTPNENIEVVSVNATDEDTLVGLFVGDGAWKPGSEFVEPDLILRGVATITQVANQWTPGAVTWSQSLKEGKYAVVGMVGYTYKAANPGLTLMRLTGLDGAWRPGVVAQIGGNQASDLFKPDDKFESWPVMDGITFPHTALPGIEVLSPYANTAEVIELSIKKL